MQFEWIGTIPTKYQPLGEDSDNKSPSFLHHLSKVCQVGHTIDRRIKPSMLSCKSCLCDAIEVVFRGKVVQYQ